MFRLRLRVELVSDKTKAALIALFQIILFILIPIVALNYFPAELTQIFQTYTGFNLQNLILYVAAVGFAIAGLTFIKNIKEESSYIHLLSSIALQFLELYLFLFFVGIGDPLSFGKTVTTFGAGIPVNITFDLQFFAITAIIIVLLKVGIIVLNFSQLRIKKK